MSFLSTRILAAKAEKLARTDFSERDRPTGEDHPLHVAGGTCQKCGRPIEPGQAARLRGKDDWVHDMCPGATD